MEIVGVLFILSGLLMAMHGEAVLESSKLNPQVHSMSGKGRFYLSLVQKCVLTRPSHPAAAQFPTSYQA